jgi:hypothetical protein
MGIFSTPDQKRARNRNILDICPIEGHAMGIFSTTDQ